MINLSFVMTLVSLAFIFFIFSVMASMIYEYYSKLLKRRGTFLAQSLSKILKDEYVNGVDFSLMLYDHPLVTSLKQDRDTYPSYLDARTFAVALVEVVIQNGVSYTFENQTADENTTVTEALPGSGTGVLHDSFDNYKSALDKLANSSVKTLLASFLVNAKDNDGLQKNVELWYNEYMERSSGWYKKMTGSKMFRISVALTLFFNIDTIHIIKSLETNSSLNSTIADAAKLYVATNKDTKFDTVSAKQVKELMVLSDSLGVPVGYDFTNQRADKDHQSRMDNFIDSLRSQSKDDGGWALMLFGWIISAVAISKGAPFWFDLLSRLVNLRSTGNKPKPSKTDD